MPLTVQQLNADTTFLLTFSAPTSESEHEPRADLTVLVDPWLTGPSPIFHSYVAQSRHTTASLMVSLRQLPEPPDLVVISQPKNDHCNKATLCTLPPSWEGTIAAVPAAAKKIRSWQHFADGQIVSIPPYNAKSPDTIIEVAFKKASATSITGKIDLAYIPQPYDLSAVHNAIGITYRPPDSPTSTNAPLTMLYTPHGLSPSLLQPYLTFHLQSHPLDLLFHSLNVEANPKLLGGVVSNGAPGGVEIAKMAAAKVWLSAHDEAKENSGIATRLIRSRVIAIGEVRAMLKEAGCEGTMVEVLGVGGKLRAMEDEGMVEEWVRRTVGKQG